jgi:transposase-like protein
MAESILSAPYFHNEEAAYAFVESQLWADGVVCPHCGVIGNAGKLQGKSTRIGLWKCYDCRKPFSVKVGTIFESSHIPMRLWLQAIFLIASSKKGISSNQLHRTLGITLKSAWFMSHRIREAMRDAGIPFGGGGSIVEVDETVMTPIKGLKVQKAGHHRNKVVSLVQRGGAVRSFHLANVDANNIGPIMMATLRPDTHLMTDGAGHYRALGKKFERHEAVAHSQGEYARASEVHGVVAHTNSVEGFFGIMKRGISGVYQHVSTEHLQRYVTEFDFRYTNRVATGVNDGERARRLLKGVSGKRLTYQTTIS